MSCTCGSGAHPRRCAVHPDAFDRHIAELRSERDPGDEDDSPLAALERHIDGCSNCRPWSICREGSALLERMTSQLAKRIAPEPVTPGEA